MPVRETEPISWAYCPDRSHINLAQKFAGLIEPLLVIAASLLFAILAQRMIQPGLGQTLGLADGSAPNFLASALALIKQLGLQYGGMLVLVLGLGFARGRRSRESYALTKGKHTTLHLIGIGLIGGAVAAIPSEAIFIAKELYPLGQDTPIWALIETVEWGWQFWIFMAVGSFILVPILEELSWRGYVLGRLVETFHPATAVLLTAVTFGLLHTQYLASGDALGFLTLGSVIFSALVFGVMTLWTGSLWPAVIAHMMINMPKSFEIGIGVLVTYLVVTLIFGRVIGRIAAAFIKDLICKDTAIALALIIVLAGIGLIATALQTTGLIILWIAAVVSVTANIMLSRSAWAVTQT